MSAFTYRSARFLDWSHYATGTVALALAAIWPSARTVAATVIAITFSAGALYLAADRKLRAAVFLARHPGADFPQIMTGLGLDEGAAVDTLARLLDAGLVTQDTTDPHRTAFSLT